MLKNPRYAVTLVQMARLGDLAQTHPLLERLRRSHGNGAVSLIVEAGLAGLAGGMVGAGNVCSLDLSRLVGFGGGAAALWSELRALAANLSRCSADRVINLNYHPAAALLAELVPSCSQEGSRRRDIAAGKPSDDVVRQLFAATTGARRGKRHLADLWLEYAGGADGGYTPLRLSDEVTGRGEGMLAEVGIPAGEQFAVVIPGAGLPARAWPVEHFKALTTALAQRLPVVLVGTSGDADLAAAVTPETGVGHPVASLCGRTDPQALAALLQRALLTVGVDTGALQLAAVVGTRCLGIYYGSMNFRETGPYGAGNLVVAPAAPDYPCFEWELERAPQRFASAVPPEAVIDAAGALLDGEMPPYHPGVENWRSELGVGGLTWRQVDKHFQPVTGVEERTVEYA